MPKETVDTIKKKLTGRAAQLAEQEAAAMGRSPKGKTQAAAKPKKKTTKKA